LIDERLTLFLECLDGVRTRRPAERQIVLGNKLHQRVRESVTLSIFRPVVTVLYPAAKAAFAMSVRMPRPAPVINSTFPSFLSLIAFSLYSTHTP
jgi:hypothetical protein